MGKTTLARILSKCLNCLSAKTPVTIPCDTCNSCVEIKAGRHLDFLEIDAASKTGVDDMKKSFRDGSIQAFNWKIQDIPYR